MNPANFFQNTSLLSRHVLLKVKIYFCVFGVNAESTDYT
jgi:hypothetical protein